MIVDLQLCITTYNHKSKTYGVMDKEKVLINLATVHHYININIDNQSYSYIIDKAIVRIAKFGNKNDFFLWSSC